MHPSADQNDAAASDAARELAQVQGRIEEARAVLVRLLQDVVVAESRINVSQTARLLEANEELVLAALHAQTEADTAAQALDEVSRTTGIDPLTQLPTRVLLLDRLAHALAGARRHGTRLALLFLDLDNFKEINDAYGHGVGDEVLGLVAKRLAASTRSADTVSRFGGDEFLILLGEVSRPSDAALIANKVISAIAAPSRVGEHLLRLSVSIGISVYPDDGDEAGTLIARADAAMYRAKRHGSGCFALHGQDPVGTPSPATPSRTALVQGGTEHDAGASEQERRHAQLREANEQLVLTVLSTRELQAAAEQAQQRQAEFLAVVAHELGSPMAPIRLATAMLGRARTDEPLLPRVRGIIERQLAQMSRLVGGLCNGSRVGGDAAPLDRTAVDIVAVIEAAVLLFQSLMDTRRQRLHVHCPPATLAVQGDPIRLAQIVRNLLDNASKYTAEGGEIELSAVVAGDEIVITVSDNGVGISAQALPHVFEPFVQDAQALGLNGVGLGIGLTVVRALVQAHGGSVVARSAGSGCGSQFVVTLPLAARVREH
jgi:diguanylate cyclase